MTTMRQRGIKRIDIIDDQEYVRLGYGEVIKDLGAEPVYERGPLPLLSDFVRAFECDAAISDLSLRVSRYAEFDGAELVAALYEHKKPAVLCTQWQARIDDIRRYRRFIPCVLSSQQLNVDSIERGIEDCMREFRGDFSQSRRPWRTLVRFEEVDAHFAYMVIPAWSSSGVKLMVQDLPDWLQHRLGALSGEILRTYVHCNLGAEHDGELYFFDWEKTDE